MLKQLISRVKHSNLVRPAGIIVVAFIIAGVIIATKPVIDTQPVVRVLPTVVITTVTPESMLLHVEAQGVVSPRSEVQLMSEVDGRVKNMSPNLVVGGYIHHGELLLSLDDEDYQDAVSLSEAARAKAEVEFELASAELQRLEKLYSKKLASESQLDQARRTAKVATANFNESHIRLKRAQRDLARTQLFAPFDGRIRQEQVENNQFIRRGELLATVYATDYVEVRLPMNDRQLAFLDLSLSSANYLAVETQMDAVVAGEFAGKQFQWPGKLVRLEAELDTDSRMVYAVVRVSNSVDIQSTALQVGMYVNVSIAGRKYDNIIQLPRSSLYQHNQVLVLDEASRLRVRDIDILRIDKDQILVRSGLSSGEKIALMPPPFVIDGVEVMAVTSSLSIQAEEGL